MAKSAQPVRFGLSLPNRAVLFGMPPGLLLETAAEADRSGRFHSVWVGDKFLSKPRLEAIVLLSAVAARRAPGRSSPPSFGRWALNQRSASGGSRKGLNCCAGSGGRIPSRTTVVTTMLAFGSPAAVAEKIAVFLDAGCTTPILRFVSPDQRGQLESCLAEVLPALAKR